MPGIITPEYLDLEKLIRAAKMNLERDGELLPTAIVLTNRTIVVAGFPEFGPTHEQKRALFGDLGRRIREEHTDIGDVTALYFTSDVYMREVPVEEDPRDIDEIAKDIGPLSLDPKAREAILVFEVKYPTLAVRTMVMRYTRDDANNPSKFEEPENFPDDGQNHFPLVEPFFAALK